MEVICLQEETFYALVEQGVKGLEDQRGARLERWVDDEGSDASARHQVEDDTAFAKVHYLPYLEGFLRISMYHESGLVWLPWIENIDGTNCRQFSVRVPCEGVQKRCAHLYTCQYLDLILSSTLSILRSYKRESSEISPLSHIL